MRFWVVGVAVVSVLFGLGIVWNNREYTIYWEGIKIQKVHERLWPKDQSLVQQFLREIIDQNQPCIIKECSQLEDHGIETLWDPEWVTQHIPYFKDVRIQKNNHQFNYFNPSRGFSSKTPLYGTISSFFNASRQPSIPSRPEFDIISMYANDFFHKIQRERNQHEKERMYMYFSGHASHADQETFLKLERATNSFVLLDDKMISVAKDVLGDAVKLENEIAGKHVNIWAGGQNVTAIAHYDTSYNFFFQMYGKKQFILFPPEQTWLLYLHSFLHPYYRRTQVNLEQNFPFKNQLNGYQALLEVGDLLYLPPYWFHHVRAYTDISISMNTWVNSLDYWLTENIFASPIPFESDWSHETTLCVLLQYIDFLLVELAISVEETVYDHFHPTPVLCQNDKGESVVLSHPLEQFFRLLFHSRYEFSLGIIPEDNLLITKSRNTVISCVNHGNKELERLARGMKYIGPYFSNMSSDGIRLINFVNYIETLLQMVVGIEDVHPFVQTMYYLSYCK